MMDKKTFNHINLLKTTFIPVLQHIKEYNYYDRNYLDTNIIVNEIHVLHSGRGIFATSFVGGIGNNNICVVNKIKYERYEILKPTNNLVLINDKIIKILIDGKPTELELLQDIEYSDILSLSTIMSVSQLHFYTFMCGLDLSGMFIRCNDIERFIRHLWIRNKLCTI